jgi:hypothetical protein
LERKSRGVVIGGDDHEIVVVVGDRLVQQRRLEAGKCLRVRAVEDDVMHASVQSPIVAANERICRDKGQAP